MNRDSIETNQDNTIILSTHILGYTILCLYRLSSSMVCARNSGVTYKSSCRGSFGAATQDTSRSIYSFTSSSTNNTFAFRSGRIAHKWKDKEYSVSFGAFLAISQNTLILVSHVPENLMKKLKISPFGKIGKGQNSAKYEN